MFDLFKTACHRFHFRWCFSKVSGLCRAQVPGADKGALDAIQQAAVGTCIAAMRSPSAEQLLIGNGDVRQMVKQQVLEIRPHTGPPAAIVCATRAQDLAQTIHDGKKDREVQLKTVGQVPGFVQRMPIFSIVWFRLALAACHTSRRFREWRQ